MTFNHKPNLQLDFFLWSKPFVVQVYFDLKKSSYDCQSYLRAYLSTKVMMTNTWKQMSNHLGDCFKFCSLLRESELYLYQ